MRDTMQPDPERGTPFERIEPAPGVEERFLGQVLSHLRTSREVEQVAIDVGVVVAGELVPGLRIALPQLLDQPRFRRRQAGRSAWIEGGRVPLLAAVYPAPAQKEYGFDSSKNSGQPYWKPEDSLKGMKVPDGWEVIGDAVPFMGGNAAHRWRH